VDTGTEWCCADAFFFTEYSFHAVSQVFQLWMSHYNMMVKEQKIVCDVLPFPFICICVHEESCFGVWEGRGNFIRFFLLLIKKIKEQTQRVSHSLITKTGFLWGNMYKRDHLEDTGIDWRIVLKWILRK
jgi:hypothetical protein